MVRTRGSVKEIDCGRARGELVVNKEARSELLQMMGLVAAVVAVVILVFFALGYLFGRLFL